MKLEKRYGMKQGSNSVHNKFNLKKYIRPS